MGKSLFKVLVLWCTFTVSIYATAQTISYQWLNASCANTITCDGCTACNMPENGSPGFFGTNMIYVGITACPYPTASGDNSIFSIGWPMFPDPDHYTMLSGIATNSMQVDSIVIRHARTTTGPERLRVSYSANPMQPFIEIADLYVDWNFQTTVITDLGCIDIPPGNPYGSFQLKLQAYESTTNDGSWVLDELRIVGSSCSGIPTAIEERYDQRVNDPKDYLDVLGRPVSGPDVAPGVYLGGKRVVKVF